MIETRQKWQVVIPAKLDDWQTASPGVDWIEAPDGIAPGYTARRYDSEHEALAAARVLRATLMPGEAAIFFDAATMPVTE